jgi:tetratricopeptide (TPR) repeat protein
MMKKLGFISCFLACIATSQAQAEIDKTTMKFASQLITVGKTHEAYLLLNKQKKTSPQDWFLFGLAAKQSGDFLAAKHAMQRVIKLDPRNANRAKLELASAQFALEQTDDARRLLSEVKADNPPDNVRQNIDRFLALIGDRHCQTRDNERWCANASASFIYDSNVNNATRERQVTLFGLPFTLSDDARAQSDTAVRLGANFDHIKTLSDTVAWQSGFSINFTDYSTLDRYDTLQLLASTGPVFQVDEKTRVSIPITAEAVSFTDQGDFYSTSIGVAPQVRYQLDETIAVNLNGSISRKHFIDNGERDTTSYSFNPSFDFQTCGQGTLRVGGGIGRDDSGIGIYSNDNWQLNASLFCSLGEGLALSIFGSYGQSDYDEREAANSVVREDIRRSIGANLRYENVETGWDVTIGANYTDNDSNLTLYTYDRLQATAEIRKKF